MDISGNRRNSLPEKSRPRPSRLSLAPAKGILKRADNDDNNTVIGVMNMAHQNRRVSMATTNRRISFAPHRVDIFSSRSTILESPQKAVDPASPRRSPRLAAKRPTPDPNYISSSSPARKNPKKIRTASPARSNVVLEDTANHTLISFDTESDNETMTMDMTLPFTIRADQSPLKPVQSAARISSAAREKRKSPQVTSTGSPRRSPRIATLSPRKPSGTPLKAIPFPNLAPLANFQDDELKPTTATPGNGNNKENTVRGNENTRDKEGALQNIQDKESMPQPSDYSQYISPEYGAMTFGVSSFSGFTPQLTSPAWPSSLSHLDEMDMDFTRPLRSPRKKLIERITSMSPKKGSMPDLASPTQLSDSDMDITINRVDLPKQSFASNIKLASPSTLVQVEEDMDFTAVAARTPETDIPQPNEEEDDMDITRPMRSMNNEAEDEGEEDDGMDITRPMRPLNSGAKDEGEEEEDDDMDLTKSMHRQPQAIAAQSYPETHMSESENDMDLTRPMVRAVHTLDHDESDMDITKPMRTTRLPEQVNDGESDMDITNHVPRGQSIENVSASVTRNNLAESSDIVQQTKKFAASLEKLGSSKSSIAMQRQPAGPLPSLIDMNDEEDNMELTTYTTQHTTASVVEQPALVARTQDIVRARTIRDLGYTNITVSDFLSRIGIEFMDDFLAGRRNHSSIGLSEDTAIEGRDPEFADYIVAAASQFPLLNMYEFACRELKVDNDNVKESFVQWETDTAEDNPVLFQEFIEASAATKQIMKGQFQLLKSYSREEAKSAWYQWRAQLTRGLTKDLDRNLYRIRRAYEGGLSEDLTKAQNRHQQTILKEQEIADKIQAAKKKLGVLEKLKAENGSENQEQHQNLKKNVKQNKNKVRHAQEQLEVAAQEMEDIVEQIGGLLEKKGQLLDKELPSKEAEKKSLRKVEDADVEEKEAKYRQLLDITLWRSATVDSTDSGVSFEYLDGKLLVVIRPNGLSVVNKDETNEIRKYIFAKLQSRLENMKNTTVQTRLELINEYWLKSVGLCNAMDRLTITFDTKVCNSSSGVLNLEIQLLDEKACVRRVEVSGDMNNLLISNRMRFQCRGDVSGTVETLDELTQLCLQKINEPMTSSLVKVCRT